MTRFISVVFSALQQLLSKVKQKVSIKKSRMTLLKSIGVTDETFLFRLELAPGGSIPVHTHLTLVEKLEVIEGELTLVVDSEAQRLSAGQSSTVATQTQHSYVNTTSQPVVAIIEFRPLQEATKRKPMSNNTTYKTRKEIHMRYLAISFLVLLLAACDQNKPPVAAFSLTPESGTAPLEVTASSTSTDADGTIANVTWDWGDGSAADTGASATHTYTTEGTFSVKLSVTDNENATVTTEKIVTVATPDESPIPDEPAPTPTGGVLDKGFGNEGKVVFFDGDDFSPMAMATLPDGKIVTLTTIKQLTDTGEEKTFYLVRRFNTDGTLDPRFGQDGKFTALEADLNLGPIFNEAAAITVADSERICFVGTSSRDSRFSGDRPVVGCVTPEGETSGFDDNGFAFPLSSQSGNPEMILKDIEIDPTTGDVVIGGTISTSTDDNLSRFWFFRMDANGGNNDGAGRETIISFPNQNADLNSFAFEADGDIVAVGSVFDSNTGTDTAVATLSKTNQRKVKVFDLDPPGDEFAKDIVIDDQGRAVIAVSLEFNDSANEKGMLARLNTETLELDPSFGNAGLVQTSGPEEFFTSVALDSQNRIVAAGAVFNVIGNEDDLFVARFLDNGAPDTTFGTSATPGKTSFDFDKQDDEVRTLALDSSGRIVLGGETGDAFILSRLNP